MSDPARVLVVSHGHPDISTGGGEIAALNLHRALGASGEFRSVFLARHDDVRRLHGGTPFAGTGRPDEILFHSTMPDWFRFSQPDPARVWRDFREALDAAAPDIVHFHHYVHLGLELLREVKNRDPHTPILLTLHEYFAQCHNHGQMVRTDARTLCRRATPDACARCFPSRTAQDFALREGFVKAHFALVDRFVAPSAFLAQRYVDWGVHPDRIEVIENLLDDDAAVPNRERAANGPLRIGFFGQINDFKGVEVLLEAVASLAPPVRDGLRVDINGSGLERQGAPLQKRIARHVRRSDGAVRLRGAYRSDEVGALMRDTDWMVLPSRWWENSPVVILEARRAGLPVICGDIGGMAEKVEHGVTGLHFRVGRADSLAERLTEVVAGGEPMRRAFAQRMAATWRPEADRARHLALHREVLARAPGQVPAAPEAFDRAA